MLVLKSNANTCMTCHNLSRKLKAIVVSQQLVLRSFLRCEAGKHVPTSSTELVLNVMSTAPATVPPARSTGPFPLVRSGQKAKIAERSICLRYVILSVGFSPRAESPRQVSSVKMR